MSAPLDTSLIENRLKDAVPELQMVEGMAEYATIKDLREFRPGSAYVVLAGERNPNSPDSAEGARSRGKSQALCTFGVVIVARNYRGRSGKEALQDVSPLVGKVRDALVGWSPVSPFKPIVWLSGDVMEYDNNTLLWLDVYTTTHFIGGNS